MRTIDRAINKTTTAKMGSVSRLALATVGAMVMWHGAAVADSAAPAPSSVAAAASAAVLPFTAGKQVVAIYQNPSTDDLITYWWSDGSYSDWIKSQKRFLGVSPDQGSWMNDRGWPAGKRVAAIYQNPSTDDYITYWWSDGSYSDWSKSRQEFIGVSPDQGVWMNGRGWPAGKRVAAIYQNPNPEVPHFTSYYWSDGSYSDWDNNEKKFVGDVQNIDGWLGPRGWPAGKRVAAIYQNPSTDDLITYWWSDGSYSDWIKSQKRFLGVSPDQGSWMNDRGWPTIPAFDPSKYEVRDVRVNQYSAGNGAIYANGRMQYKVDVRVQIVDRAGKGVDLSERGTGVNRAGQLRDLVTLYRGDRRVDTAGANLAIDNVGDNASSRWKASRTDAGYDQYLNALAHYSVPIGGTVVEDDQGYQDDQDDQDDEGYDAVYPVSNGWNTYTYWVSSTAQTGVDPMRICARVGSYGSGGEGYYDTCIDGRDESAKVKALPPKQYGATDYEVSSVHMWDRYQGWFYEVSVGLRGGNRISSAQVAPGSVISTNHGLSCVSTLSDSWNVALGQVWNNNTALYMVPFGSNKTEGPRIYEPWDDSHFFVPREGLNPKKINFIQSSGKIKVITSGHNAGTWADCLSWNIEGSAKHSGSIEFIDGYGNAGMMKVSPVGWDYAFN